MKKKNDETSVINVYGFANIGCTIVEPMYQTVVQGASTRDSAEEVEEVNDSLIEEEDICKEAKPESPNYFAPQKNITVLLCQDWFEEVCSNKKKYTLAWREKMVEALLNSEYKDEIAEAWNLSNKRIQLKCEIVGVLIDAGIIKGSYNKVAPRLGIENVKNETLAKYMGYAKKQPYYDWLLAFMKDH